MREPPISEAVGDDEREEVIAYRKAPLSASCWKDSRLVIWGRVR